MNRPLKDVPDVLLPDEAAKYLRVSRSELLRLVKTGEISCSRLGHKTVRYRKAVLVDYLLKTDSAA